MHHVSLSLSLSLCMCVCKHTNSISTAHINFLLFQAYFGCFVKEYDIGLYRAHLEAMYKGLLVHMDDPDINIQQAVLGTFLTHSGYSSFSLL